MKEVTELKNSPYVYETEQGVKFYFTTLTRKCRFEKVYKQRGVEMMNRLFIRYGVRCVCSLSSDIDTYRRIESNGFYIVLPDGEITDISLISFRMTRA